MESSASFHLAWNIGSFLLRCRVLHSILNLFPRQINLEINLFNSDKCFEATSTGRAYEII